MAEVPQEWLDGETLGPREVGLAFNVDPRTVRRWAQEGVIGFFRTPGGNRRFPEAEVRRLVAGEPPPPFLKELADTDNAKYHKKWVAGWHRPRDPEGEEPA